MISNCLEIKKGITHSGVFHADEVMASAILSMCFPFMKIKRKIKVFPSDYSDETIIYDIGGGKYDHHQKGGNGFRKKENSDGLDIGTPYASAGLIWRDFGMRLVENEYIHQKVDSILIEGIDAVDTGSYHNNSTINLMSISTIISNYNPLWDEFERYEESGRLNKFFFSAVDEARKILLRTIEVATSLYNARAIVVDSILKRKQNEVVELEFFVPWQEHLLEYDVNKEIKYVIFPSKRGGYNIQSVPVKAGSFESRLPFLESIRGLEEKALEEKLGFPGVSFIHNSGFIAAVDKAETAYKLANFMLRLNN